MARDPELQRFADTIARLHEAGQSCIALPMRAVRNCLPWQHDLIRVLHFVCELRRICFSFDRSTILLKNLSSPQTETNLLTTTFQTEKSSPILAENYPQNCYTEYSEKKSEPAIQGGLFLSRWHISTGSGWLHGCHPKRSLTRFVRQTHRRALPLSLATPLQLDPPLSCRYDQSTAANHL